MILLLPLLFILSSCDSDGDDNNCGDFNGNWIGETISTTWNDESCGSDFEMDISCQTATVSDNNAVIDWCSCSWAYPDDECIDEAEFNCEESNDPDENDCEVSGNTITCSSSEEEGEDCIQTTTLTFVRN